MERIVVVGGAGGIGSAVVRKYEATLDAERREVIVGDIDEDAASERDLLDREGITYHPVDVRDPESIRRFRTRVKSNHGPVTHLVSLAGGALDPEFGGLEGTSMATIEESIRLNLTSHVHLAKAYKPLVEADENANRTVTLVSSINAVRDYGLPAYSSAKAGLLGLVNSTVEEFGEAGIRINAVLPGTVTTDHSLDQPKDHGALREAAALDRLSTPEDVADVVYALSHALTSVTGERIVADCGQTKMTPDFIEE